MSLIQEVADIKNLTKAWESLRSGKSEDARKALRGVHGLSIIDFEKNFKPNIEKISQDLLLGTFKIAPIKSYFIRKSAKNRYRLISPPSVEDAIVQSSILKVLKPIFYENLNNGVSYCGIAGLPKKKRVNHITALKNLHKKFSEGYYVVFESDIKSFFDMIQKDLLLEKIFKILNLDTSLNALLHDIVYFKMGNYQDLKNEGKGDLPPLNTKVGIAQGSPLSPLFANIYLSEVDKKMKEIDGGQFFRYVDDFIIVAKDKDDAERFGNVVVELLSNEGLSVAQEKTSICDLNERKNSFNFLGLNISPYCVRQKKNEHEVIKLIEQDYLNINKYKGLSSEKPKKINERLQGYANYYRCFHTQHLLNAINRSIEKKRGIKLLRGIHKVDENGKKQFMSIENWQSAFICI